MTDKNVTTLSRDAILQAPDTVIEMVSVPEWGGSVYVRSLTGTERDAFEGSLLVINKGRQSIKYEDIRAKLVVKTACDMTGVRLFSDADIPEVTKKNAAALQRIFEVAQRLSGLTNADVKELADNLGNAQSVGFISG